MAKKFFTFSGLEQLDAQKDELNFYCRFAIYWRETGEKLAEIITNRSFCGSWHYQENTGLYVQDAGTCQYSLPSTKMGVQKALKSKAIVYAGLMIDLAENDEKKAYYKEIFESLS